MARLDTLSRLYYTIRTTSQTKRRSREMVQLILSKIEALMQSARENYNVDPAIFLAIYLASGPVFYYSLYRMVRALAKRLGSQVLLWSMVFLASNVAPFVYVLFFGRNLPWWVYGVIALLIGLSLYSLIRKLRKPSPSAKLH